MAEIKQFPPKNVERQCFICPNPVVTSIETPPELSLCFDHLWYGGLIERINNNFNRLDNRVTQVSDRIETIEKFLYKIYGPKDGGI